MRKIIESDPVIMRNKLFIVKPWESSVGNTYCSIKKVLVWIKLFNIPMYAWSLLGISWLASRVIKFLCRDESTERLDRLEYAKCMVEVSPDQKLPDEFPMQMVNRSVHHARNNYLWKPLICNHYHVFGHDLLGCELHCKGKVSDIVVEEKLVAESENITKDEVDD